VSIANLQLLQEATALKPDAIAGTLELPALRISQTLNTSFALFLLFSPPPQSSSRLLSVFFLSPYTALSGSDTATCSNNNNSSGNGKQRQKQEHFLLLLIVEMNKKNVHSLSLSLSLSKICCEETFLVVRSSSHHDRFFMTQIRRQPLCPYRLARSTQGRRQKESQIIEEGVGVWGGGEGQRT
jgi:hypothetical protein